MTYIYVYTHYETRCTRYIVLNDYILHIVWIKCHVMCVYMCVLYYIL